MRKRIVHIGVGPSQGSKSTNFAKPRGRREYFNKSASYPLRSELINMRHLRDYVFQARGLAILVADGINGEQQHGNTSETHLFYSNPG